MHDKLKKNATREEMSIGEYGKVYSQSHEMLKF